jgi:hypothetical protein
MRKRSERRDASRPRSGYWSRIPEEPAPLRSVASSCSVERVVNKIEVEAPESS